MRTVGSVRAARGRVPRLGRLFLVMGALVVLCTACVHPPPVQEMSDARQTIAAARAAGAARCAAAEEATVAARRWIENASYALSIHDYPMAGRSARRAQRRAYLALVMLHVVPPRRGMSSRLLHVCPPPRTKNDASGPKPQ
ncbi:MAG: DUF4398 domain-containing protein [Gammaproteobacteria bacterium]|nr:DUF4398 domain-containing protein [Gammaproteobacteria bacterium]